MARVGFLVEELFEESEFRLPYEAVKHGGHTPVVIGLRLNQQVHAMKGKFGVIIEKGIVDINASDLDALVIPGGKSPDQLRANHGVITLVRLMMEKHKPVAAMCYGPCVLIDADVLEGRRVTSIASLKADLIAAGAQWLDKEVVVDGNLLTSRSTDELAAFCLAFTRMLDDPRAVFASDVVRETRHHER